MAIKIAANCTAFSENSNKHERSNQKSSRDLNSVDQSPDCELSKKDSR